MPAIAALTVNDGLASPVAHTFSPVTTNGAQAQWADRSPATPAGYRVINHEVLKPAGQRTVNKVTIGVYNPTEAVVDGSTVVVRSCSAQVILNLPPDCTLQERKDILAYTANTLGLAAMKTSVENIEPFY